MSQLGMVWGYATWRERQSRWLLDKNQKRHWVWNDNSSHCTAVIGELDTVEFMREAQWMAKVSLITEGILDEKNRLGYK